MSKIFLIKHVIIYPLSRKRIHEVSAISSSFMYLSDSFLKKIIKYIHSMISIALKNVYVCIKKQLKGNALNVG